ncbi:MAG TPA: glutathione S-transferase family protein [Steroidobacteraceae bacterium]|nr:glutathione S-transferase family protein [Steroidobacteraceae bacterium]
MLELYHWEPNLYYLKPLIALKEVKAEFTSHYFDPTTFEQFSPGFPQNVESQLQLEREGPLLVAGGTVLSSSFFILEYIADAFPAGALNPGGAYEHYRARAWGQYLTLQLGPGVCALGCAKYLAPVLKERDQGQLKARIERIEPQERRAAWAAVVDGVYDEPTLVAVRERLKMSVRRIEDTLAKSAWLTGAEYSIADIDAFAMLSPLPELAPGSVSDELTPRIMEFLRRVRERTAVKEALAFSKTGKPERAFVPGSEPSRWG